MLGWTLWVGGIELAVDVCAESDGDMELLLLLNDSDAEETLPSSNVSSTSSFMKI